MLFSAASGLQLSLLQGSSLPSSLLEECSFPQLMAGTVHPVFFRVLPGG